jgi:hypothetical protein
VGGSISTAPSPAIKVSLEGGLPVTNAVSGHVTNGDMHSVGLQVDDSTLNGGLSVVNGRCGINSIMSGFASVNNGSALENVGGRGSGGEINLGVRKNSSIFVGPLGPGAPDWLTPSLQTVAISGMISVCLHLFMYAHVAFLPINVVLMD